MRRLVEYADRIGYNRLRLRYGKEAVSRCQKRSVK